MNTGTTTPTPAGAPIPVPPPSWFTSEDRKRLRRRVPDAQPLESVASGWPLPAVDADIDPDRVRTVCAQIQAGSRQAAMTDRRLAAVIDAANCLAGYAGYSPADPLSRWAKDMSRQLLSFAAEFATVPPRSNIRPEVPGTGAEA